MLFVPSPTATQVDPDPFPHATSLPKFEKMLVTIPVQVTPLLERAMVLVPLPTAIQVVPLHATPLPKIEKMLALGPVTGNQMMPSLEYAILFRPNPTATHSD
jgi:hypothetical protein